MKPTSKRLLVADVVYTLLLIVSGTILALWPDTIRPSVPVDSQLLSLLPAVLWTVVVLTVVLFFWKEHWRDKHTQDLQQQAESARDEYEKELKKHLADLKTMPPKTFLLSAKEAFEASYISCREVLDHGDTEPDKLERLERGIRQVLRSILFLASEFEPDFGLYSHFATNVMLFHSVDDLSEAEQKLLEDRLVFCDESTTIARLGAVLDLRTQMSTTIKASVEGEPDETLVRGFALPIPRTGHSGTKTRIIPGAPAAAWYGNRQAMDDTRTMHEACRKHGDFTEPVLDEIKQYFDHGDGQDIRSFICIPLYGSCAVKASDGTIEDQDELVGVLNIHSDQTGLLSDENEPLDEYIFTIAPLAVLLVDLIRTWQQRVPNTVE